MKRFLRFGAVVTVMLCAFLTQHAFAEVPQVALASVAFSGGDSSVDQRFPFSQRYIKELRQAGDLVDNRMRSAIAQTPPQNIQLLPGQIDDLKGRDQALVTSLVVTSETVSVESFGALRKLFVLIRGQALFFDFKSMTVIRAYPLSFAYIDVLDHQPSDAEVLQRVKQVYEGAQGKPGIFARYAGVLAKATVPSQVPRFLKVTKVNLQPDVMNSLPAYLKDSPDVAQTWAADLVGEAISTRVGVPIIPYIEGQAVGRVMKVQISDGDVYTLKLPPPDYEITVDFSGLKKVKYSEGAAGASYIYGSFATIKIEEPQLGAVYLNTALKNGEVKVVPATQTYVDDFPAFYDSVNGLFHKLADAISGKGNNWLKSASTAPDIEAQILKTKELMNLCK